MKKIKQFFKNPLYTAILAVLSAEVEIDNYASEAHNLKKSFIFSLPTNFTIQIVSVSLYVALIILTLIFFIKYRRNNKVKKVKEQKREDEQHRLQFIEHDRSLPRNYGK